MATRKAIKAINWGALSERVLESEKNMFAAFKAKSDQYMRRVQENPENPPKIDWAMYKSTITQAGLVEKFQKEYEALKVPYPEDKYSSTIDAEGKEAETHVKKFIDESNQRIEQNKSEIQKLESLIKYADMTMEDFRDAHPDLAIDSFNRPTLFPHLPEYQPGEDDENAPAP